MDKTYTRSEVEKMLAIFGGMIIAASEVPLEVISDECREIKFGIQAAKALAKKLYFITGEDRTSCHMSAGTFVLLNAHMADAFIAIDEMYGLENILDLESMESVIKEACKQK